MKQVSNAYKSAMLASLRPPTQIKIAFYNYDTTAPADSSWADNGQLPYSSLDLLSYEHTYGQTYATLEENRWVLDGSLDILPNSNPREDGFIANKMSDASGAFSTPCVLVCSFSEPHTFPGLTFTFDSRLKEYPEQITVNYKLSGQSVKRFSVNVTSAVMVVEEPVEYCDAIEITFDKMRAYRRPRLERLTFGVSAEFTAADVINTHQRHDVDPVSRRLPKEEFTFSIIDVEHRYDPDNPAGIWQYIDQKAPITIQFGQSLLDGTVEWIKADRYNLNGRPTAKNNVATFKGTGNIETMQGQYYKSKVGTKTLYDMAVDVLTDSHISIPGAPVPWIIDESLRNIVTTAVLPIDTHPNCLQQIAHAACCKLYTDDDNIIHIVPFDPGVYTKTDFALDFGTISKDSQAATKIDPLRAVEVCRYSYSPNTESSELYNETTTKTTLHAEFSNVAQNIQISVSGGTLVSSEIYGRAADLVLSEGTKTVVITGTVLSESKTVTVYPVSPDGSIDREENSLITSEQMADALANHMIAYLSLRSTYDADYRGNPELETGDAIELQTPYTQSQDALVLVDTIDYNGSLHGKLKVKRLT